MLVYTLMGSNSNNDIYAEIVLYLAIKYIDLCMAMNICFIINKSLQRFRHINWFFIKLTAIEHNKTNKIKQN